MPEPNQKPVSVFSLEEIFAAPLRAVVTADFSAARQFMEFIEQYGFEPPDPALEPGPEDPGEARLRALEAPDHLGRLRMVSFRVEEQGTDFGTREVVMRVPALSLLPLPLLQVQDADFQFGVRLLQGMESAPSRPLKLSRFAALASGEPDPDPPQDPPVKWQAMVADKGLADPRQDQAAPQLNANINVKVRMRQADVPAGIATLLQVMGSVAQVNHA